MAENFTLDRYRKAARQVGMEVGAKCFRIHAIAYVVANVILALVNLVLTPDLLWFYFATLGWGFGLAFHYFNGYRRRAQIADEQLRRIESLARN